LSKNIISKNKNTINMDNNGILPDDSNPPQVIDDRTIVGLPPERAKKTSRNRWCLMEIASPDEKDKDVMVYTYPFTEDPRDQLLIAYLSEIKPFMKEFGQAGPAWTRVLKGLLNEKENEDDYVFKGGLAMTTIKNRWEEYQKFVKTYQARVPFNTGGDNEEGHYLIVAIEKLVNDYTDYKDKIEIAKTQKHNKRQMEMDGADNLRQAGIGNLQRNKEPNISDIEEASSNGGSSKKPPRKKLIQSFASSIMVEQHHKRQLLREKNMEKISSSSYYRLKIRK
jgi:hypothetical protein